MDDNHPSADEASYPVYSRTISRQPVEPRALSNGPTRGVLANKLTVFLVALACLLLLRYFVPYFAAEIQYAVTQARQRAEVDVARSALQELPLDQLSKAYQLVSQRVSPSVVNINVRSVTEAMPADEFASLFGPLRRESRGQGSGVIIDAAGFVVTNYHVVHGATEIEVSLADGRVVAAQAVGADPLTDLAVLKIRADNLIAAEWGDSDALEVGALVWAVGSPFGLQHSITFGILSAKNREGNSPYFDFLQTDAAVNPGNSGGPLVDARGRVIGINTAIVGESYQGISFAIPSTTARDVVDRLKAQGMVARGWLGVTLVTMSDEVAREVGIPFTPGVLVTAYARVASSPSPARQAGIQPGDIIVRWNEAEVLDSAALSRLVARTDIGSTAQVVIVRGGAEITLEVNIGARPAELN